MVALLLFYPYSGAAGRLDEADEYKAKTAQLYNFAKKTPSLIVAAFST